MSALRTIHDIPVFVLPADGEPIATEQDALDLIGNASYQGAQ